MRLRLQTMLTLLDLPLEEIPCEYHDATQAVLRVLDSFPKPLMKLYGLVAGIRRRQNGYELCAPHAVLVVADTLKAFEKHVYEQFTKARKVLRNAIIEARILNWHQYR